MPTLLERLDAQVADLRTEKARIIAAAQTDAAAVDVKLDALREARKVITPAVETAYAQLKAMGIFKEF